MLPGLTRGREKLAFNAWKRWPLFPCPIPALRRLPVLRNRHGTPPFCILQHVCRRAPAPHVNHRNIRWPGPVPASQKRVPIGRYGAWVCHQYRVPRLRALVRKYGPDPASPIFSLLFLWALPLPFPVQQGRRAYKPGARLRRSTHNIRSNHNSHGIRSTCRNIPHSIRRNRTSRNNRRNWPSLGSRHSNHGISS